MKVIASTTDEPPAAIKHFLKFIRDCTTNEISELNMRHIQSYDTTHHTFLVCNKDITAVTKVVWRLPGFQVSNEENHLLSEKMVKDNPGVIIIHMALPGFITLSADEISKLFRYDDDGVFLPQHLLAERYRSFIKLCRTQNIPFSVCASSFGAQLMTRLFIDVYTEKEHHQAPDRISFFAPFFENSVMSYFAIPAISLLVDMDVKMKLHFIAAFINRIQHYHDGFFHPREEHRDIAYAKSLPASAYRTLRQATIEFQPMIPLIPENIIKRISVTLDHKDPFLWRHALRHLYENFGFKPEQISMTRSGVHIVDFSEEKEMPPLVTFAGHAVPPNTRRKPTTVHSAFFELGFATEADNHTTTPGARPI
ncbi:MAG: hypothetical protein COB66_05985 [Coxiella sp. (in: Bacteria)]|nr:MAG: hypothetical protein COB66_05985 [Coxiella sp. (in: g-proteobacteria)]